MTAHHIAIAWTAFVLTAAALVVGVAIYVAARWRRAPAAFRAMRIIAGLCFLAGVLAGAWALHLAVPSAPDVLPAPSSSAAPSPATMSAPAAPASSASTAARTFAGKVVGITDGDTLTALDSSGGQEVIRLAGIDAPEHDQVFGSQSTANLAALVSGKVVMLDCGKEESYGRLVCKVALPNGEDVDLDQVKAGLAWHYKQYESEQSHADRQAYATAEDAAREAHLGLWADAHPVPPWDFRQLSAEQRETECKFEDYISADGDRDCHQDQHPKLRIEADLKGRKGNAQQASHHQYQQAVQQFPPKWLHLITPSSNSAPLSWGRVGGVWPDIVHAIYQRAGQHETP